MEVFRYTSIADDFQCMVNGHSTLGIQPRGIAPGSPTSWVLQWSSAGRLYITATWNLLEAVFEGPASPEKPKQCVIVGHYLVWQLYA